MCILALFETSVQMASFSHPSFLLLFFFKKKIEDGGVGLDGGNCGHR